MKPFLVNLAFLSCTQFTPALFAGLFIVFSGFQRFKNTLTLDFLLQAP